MAPRTVGYIGSCRIATPLKHAAQFSGAELTRNRNYGFCHSIPEILQQAQVVLGDEPPKPKLWPLVARNCDREGIAREKIQIPDLLFVEISSAKSIYIDNVPVQLNYLNAEYPQVFASRSLSKRFWQAIEEGTIRSHLEAKFSKTLNEDDFDILSSITLQKTSLDDLSDGIRTLQNLFPSIVFLPHVNARDANGQILESRNHFIHLVEEAAEDTNARLFSPTDLMERLGQSFVMEHGSDSLSHYSVEFGAFMGSQIAQRFMEASSPKKPTSLDRRMAEADRILSDVESKSQRSDFRKRLKRLFEKGFHRKIFENLQDRVENARDISHLCSLIASTDGETPRDLIVQLILQAAQLEGQDELTQLVEGLSDQECSNIWKQALLDCSLMGLRALARAINPSEEIRPKIQRRLRHAARAYHDADDLQNLKEIAEFEIPLIENPPEVALYLARIAAKSDDWETSFTFGKQACQSFPDNLGAWIRYERAARALGKSQESEDAKEKISKLQSEDVAA